MKIHGMAAPALALLLSAAGLGFSARAAAAQEYGWDTPPREFNEIQQHGFRDGMEAARDDFKHNRPADLDRHDTFRKPDVPGDMREPFRDAFRRGYETAMSHLTGASAAPMVAPPPPPPPPDQGRGWEQRQFSDLERRGFEDGRRDAQFDIQNRRRPDPGMHDEYRDPHLPADAADQYRAGFRRGYQEQIAQLYGAPQDAPWDFVPNRFSEVSQRGFHEGVEGARRDIESHRRPDPDAHEEYRNPHVPPQLVDDYREGFRLGYERAIAHFMNGQPGY
jgi:hypothetical protein